MFKQLYSNFLKLREKRTYRFYLEESWNKFEPKIVEYACEEGKHNVKLQELVEDYSATVWSQMQSHVQPNGNTSYDSNHHNTTHYTSIPFISSEHTYNSPF